MPVHIFDHPDNCPAALVALFPDASASLFDSVEWFKLLARTAMDEGQSPRLYALEEDGNFVAAIYMSTRNNVVSAIQTREISSFSNFYTMNFSPVFAAGVERSDALAEIFAFMHQERPRWDVIRIAPLDEDDGTLALVADALKKAGFLTRPYFEFGNWYEPVVDGGFDEFAAARPSRLRNTWRRRSRKLEREHQTDFVITTNEANTAPALAAYEKIYAESWKEPELYPDFIPALISTTARAGLLRMGTFYVDDEPAASQIWLIDGHRAVIYKLAYDEKFRDLSVGTVLTMKMAEHAIEVDKVQEIDYGSGDDSYKKEWMSKRRERKGVIACNPSTIKGLAKGLKEKIAAMTANARYGR